MTLDECIKLCEDNKVLFKKKRGKGAKKHAWKYIAETYSLYDDKDYTVFNEEKVKDWLSIRTNTNVKFVLIPLPRSIRFTEDMSAILLKNGIEIENKYGRRVIKREMKEKATIIIKRVHAEQITNKPRDNTGGSFNG